MSKTRNLSDLLDANGDVKSTALDNVPASDVVNDTTPQLGGTLDMNGFNINGGDDDQIQLGASNDLQIFHDGTHSQVRETGTGDLLLKGDANVKIQNSSGTEDKAIFTSDGAVQLYHDNAIKLTTTSSGIGVFGDVGASNLDLNDNAKLRVGTSDDLQIYHDGSNSYIVDQGSGDLFLRGSNDIWLQTGDGTETYARLKQNDAVELYYDNAKKLETSSSGATVTGRLFASTGETISVGAWCKFLGTGTVTLQDDYNVGSITDVSSGQYDINFSTNCNNADYAIAGTSTATNHSGWNIKSAGIQSAPTKLQTGSVRIVTENQDSYYVSFMAFGDW